MLGDKFKNIKALIKTKSDNNNDNKKKIENLVVFLILLIITIIAINIILGDNKNSNQNNNAQNSQYKQLASEVNNNYSNISSNSEYNLEKELEDILSNISGVGQVKVLVTYSQTSEIVPMYNENSTESTTQETDTNGGVRTIQQTDNSKEIIYQEQSTKVNIIQAVEAVTGLPTHKVQVFEMN